jgi:integrase/recombinase XerD
MVLSADLAVASPKGPSAALRAVRPISQNTGITKFNPLWSTAMIATAEQTLADFAAQNGSAKSAKAEIIRRIARLVRREGLSYEDWRYVARRVRSACGLRPAKQPKRLPRVLTEEGFRRFYHAVDRAADVQHALMLRLLFYTGVRVSELCNIQVADVDLDACKVRINSGKGGKDRFVLFGKSFATALRTHLAAHPKSRWLFQTRRHAKYSPRRVQQIVKQYATAAGVAATPHTFRHQAITWLTKSGMADAELQLITGHSRRETLAVYQHVALGRDVADRYQAAMTSVGL